MSPGPRDYKPTTTRRLDTLSGNQCAKPGCSKQLIAEDGQSIISKICHIEAAGSKGTRYNSDMNDDDRRHYNNLILLCDEHHTIIDNRDNEDQYPVELLQEWKRDHESKNLGTQLIRNPSLLAMAVVAIADIDFDESYDAEDSSESFSIENKISYNAIKRNKALIEEYKQYYGKLNIVYAEMERQGSFKKIRLLRHITNIYLKVKGVYVGNAPDSMAIIRENADNIIDAIRDELFEIVIKTASHEDAVFGVDIIMIDAFMRCKILEEPS